MVNYVQSGKKHEKRPFLTFIEQEYRGLGLFLLVFVEKTVAAGGSGHIDDQK